MIWNMQDQNMEKLVPLIQKYDFSYIQMVESDCSKYFFFSCIYDNIYSLACIPKFLAL